MAPKEGRPIAEGVNGLRGLHWLRRLFDDVSRGSYRKPYYGLLYLLCYDGYGYVVFLWMSLLKFAWMAIKAQLNVSYLA